MTLYMGLQKITPTSSGGNNTSTEDWGNELYGSVTTDATFICAPYKCSYNSSITSFIASDATIVNSLYQTFQGCNNLVSVLFPSLETVKRYGMYGCFQGCTSLTSVSFPSLETIEGYGFSYCFQGCTSLTSVVFTSLSSLGEYAFGMAGMSSYSCFNGCSNLSSVSFPALTTTSFGEYTNQFSALFDTNTASSSGSCVVHFPSNLESTIQGLSGYPYFIARNGTNTRISLAFDLPATS